MAIRVLIEREIEPGQELKVHTMLTQLRSRAMSAKGYISGETLRALDNPNTFLVISTWNSTEEWKAWRNHPERKAFQEELDKLLRSPEKLKIYQYL